MDAALDVDALRGWVGRRREAADTATPQRIAALAATLDREGPPPALLPPLWHWTLFHDATPQRELGADGHARRGGFLPPVPLPRRMWAGGRIEFRAPVRAGDTLYKKGGVLHGCRCIERGVLLDTFTPQRTDFLAT